MTTCTVQNTKGKSKQHRGRRRVSRVRDGAAVVVAIVDAVGGAARACVVVNVLQAASRLAACCAAGWWPIAWLVPAAGAGAWRRRTPSTAKPQAATSSTTNLTWRITRLTHTRGGWEGRVLASAGCAVFCIFIFTYFHFTFTCRCSLEMPWPWSSEQTSFHGESRSLCAHARERKWKIPFLQRAPQIAASADRPLAICSNCSSTVV